MRLQLTRRRARARWWAVLVGVGAGVVSAGVVPAYAGEHDHVTVRGAYYREASTRVVQPVVEVGKDLPGGFDIGATYLLDAITSASVAAGVTGDATFTELRNEVGLMAGWTPSWGRLTLRYRYSAESDYWSQGAEAAGSVRLWGDTATLAGAVGAGRDGVWPRGQRTPACPTQDQSICFLNTFFVGGSYTQVLSPRLVAQLGVEGSYLSGFQDAVYRLVPNHGYDHVPDSRWRLVVTPRVAYYFPSTQTGVQGQYRFYRDQWSINAHMGEVRVYQTVARDFELRGSFRYYTQSPAYFWCDWMAAPECYSQQAVYYTADPKLQHVRTSMPELKLTWDAVRLRGVPFLGWFAEGSFEVSYARLFQNTVFGNAHVLQMGYTLPY
jgi:hypothetical protein